MTLTMFGPYVHDIDPVIGTILGVHLWWYGLAYSLGLLVVFFVLRGSRKELGLSRPQVYDLTLWIGLGTLLGARIVEVAFYEWPFYREHPDLIPAYWLGGMSTHGVLAGASFALWAFCRIKGVPFLRLADVLCVAAAFTLGIGRIGNFIDGQIVGSQTSAWWAVKFPDADGFRHPTVLYDGIKNLLLIPLLLYVNKRRPAAGTITGLFLFLYAFLRIGIDVLRIYPTSLLGLATGQALNIAMSIGGLALLAWCRPQRSDVIDAVGRRGVIRQSHRGPAGCVLWRKTLFAALLVFVLVIPSDWTQDIPARYGKRHAGLQHSALYPAIGGPDTRLEWKSRATTEAK